MNKKKMAGIVVILLLVIYLAGRFYFKNHFYPNTNINSVKCSFKTKEQAIKLTADHLNTYVLTIHDDVTDMTVTAEDAGLRYEDTAEIGSILEKQNYNLWFTEFLGKHHFTAMSTSLDEEKLIAYLNTLECMNPEKPQKPVSAKITYNENKNAYELIDEIIGNTIIPEKFYRAVADIILRGDTSMDLTTTEYYKQPKYKAKDSVVQEAKATVDKYMKTVINYEDSGLTFMIDSTVIHDFIKISKDFEVNFDKDTIKSYVSDKISPVFNTVGSTRKINSPGSGNITISGGSFGWQVGLIAEREQIINDIKSGETVTRKPEYLQDGKARKKDDDIGNSYIDVSISQQTLWVVENGKVKMSSPFVSGDPRNGYDTDKGVYMIEYKRTNYEMRDYNVTVKYWLPFNTDVGEGFHDATWRSSFGGSIYRSNGSHGCVNLPYDFAKKLYETVPVGYPVIVH